MTDIQWDRWARGAGVPFAILLVAGFSLFGDAPKVDASGSEVAAFYSDNGGRILTAVPIIAVALLFFLWFSGAVANLLRESGQGERARHRSGPEARDRRGWHRSVNDRRA